MDELNEEQKQGRWRRERERLENEITQRLFKLKTQEILDTPRQLDSEQWQSVQLQRAGANHVLPQNLTIRELHHDERLAALLADVVDRADVGMVESRRGLRFTSSIRESVSR